MVYRGMVMSSFPTLFRKSWKSSIPIEIKSDEPDTLYELVSYNAANRPISDRDYYTKRKKIFKTARATVQYDKDMHGIKILNERMSWYKHNKYQPFNGTARKVIKYYGG